jgi:hypothetical protein
MTDYVQLVQIVISKFLQFFLIINKLNIDNIFINIGNFEINCIIAYSSR